MRPRRAGAQFLTSQENTEALYRMFSQLLDRKLQDYQRGLRRLPRLDRPDQEDDIQDDYLSALNLARSQPAVARRADRAALDRPRSQPCLASRRPPDAPLGV